MKNRVFLKIFIFLVLLITAYGVWPFFSQSQAKGVKTSYKRYTIFTYENVDVLCEPYTVNKDDWLYKIFRKKGEISEKDFPRFIIIFKKINPQISNIDAIEPGNHILIPLKKVEKGGYDQAIPGTVDIPVIEFSMVPEDLNLKPFIQEHKIKKGEIVSRLIDKAFLKKGGTLSEEGLKAFHLANPNIKNINIIYEGAEIYLPDPSIKSQPWFRSLASKKKITDPAERREQAVRQYKIEAHKLAQLKKYASLIGGTLLSHGKMVFPGENNSTRFLDLSSTPIIETPDGEKILIISGDNVNDELLEYVQSYWKDLKTQLISEALDKIKNHDLVSPKMSATTAQKKLIETLFSQITYTYIPDVKIPFMLNHITLEASFGRVIREDTTDLLINFGNVYGTALDVLKKKEFEIISITPKLTTLELLKKLFLHLGYATWENPSFSSGDVIESMTGLYAVKKKEKLFIPVTPLSQNAVGYLKKENIKILSTQNITPAQ